jgi:hypothetical protein
MKLLRTGIWLLFAAAVFAQPHHKTDAEVRDWYSKQPWMVGANYIPSTAVNQLEMWQADTFDPTTIDRELGWAESIGMNTVRVFLHDVAWKFDASGTEKRINAFLKIADKHKIRPILVLFDSCWNPFPEPGPQPKPRPGIHNSGWVQSPGAAALMKPSDKPRLLAYIQNLIAAFANDKRILAWDVWNEPDNINGTAYGRVEPKEKRALVEALLPLVFEYARAGLPTQPLTSGLWGDGDWSSPDKLTPIQKTQIENSEVISFHSYGPAEDFEKRVQWLEQYHRPILCTEYMARPLGSTFQAILPIAKKHNVGAYNWGLVAGKTQTYLPWDSWEHPYTDHQPSLWFHDVFRTTGMPYSREETDFIRSITERGLKVKK